MTAPEQLSSEERATELLSRMTLLEKVSQLTGVMAWQMMEPDGTDVSDIAEVLASPPGHVAQLIRDDPRLLAETLGGLQRTFVERTRLGIPALFHAEALNGLLAGGHMAFPTPIALSATWRPDLVGDMAAIMREQLVDLGVRHVLSPVMDVALDPRWGRVHETFGEDPYLVASYSVAYTKGMQGKDLRQGVIATGKHFLGYAASEAGLNSSTLPAGPRRLRDLFGFPFEAAIREAGLGSIMNSYGEIDGIPVAASREILSDLLRGVFGFTGFVSADYGSIEQLVTRQGVARDIREAGRLALAAGLDVEFPKPMAYGRTLAEEVESGRVPIEEVDLSVHRVLAAKFGVGLFENPYPRDSIDLSRMASDGDELSRILAQRSVTLLENDGILPIEPRSKRVAVVGPHADAPDLQFAAYSYVSWRLAVDAIHFGGEMTMVGVDSDADAWHQALLPAGRATSLSRERYGTTTFADELAERGAVVTVARGSGLTEDLGDGAISEAIDAAAGADLVIVAVGGASLWFSGERTEGEASDTADIALPAAQVRLLDAIAATGAPFVIVLVQGRPYPLPASARSARAVIMTSFAGPHAGRALVDVLSGLVEPTGRLPYSIPRHTGQLPIYHHRSTGSGGTAASEDHPEVNYLDIPTTPKYPFGFGLGYSTFAIDDLVAPEQLNTSERMIVSARVTNTSQRDGATVIQLYLRHRVSGITRPFQKLAGFQHVELGPGGSVRVRFELDATQLAATGVDMQLRVDPGTLDVVIGQHAEDRGNFRRVTIAGPSRVVERDSRTFFSTSSILN